MVRLLVGRVLAPLCAILLLSSGPATLQAEESKKVVAATVDGQKVVLPDSGHYTALEKKNGDIETRTFDLSIKKERDELAELIAAGAILHLEKADLTKLETDLGLWTVVVFLILMALLYKLAWGPMLTGLKKREESIAGALEAAQKAQEEAKKMQAELDRKMAEANQKMGAMMEDTRKAAAQQQEEMLAKARSEISAERERLRRDLDTARDQALQDLSSYAAKLATDVAARVLVRELNVADQHRLVDEALGEMRQAATDRNRVFTGN